MHNNYKVAVLGSTGYVGLELVKILSNHPFINLNFLGSENFSEKNIQILDSSIKNLKIPKISANSNFDPKKSDIVFLALPHGISHKYVKKFFNKIKIIDLSADFRLDSINTYEDNYNKDHTCPELLNSFIYGLPEINFSKINKCSYIAIPGCYPTSILLPIIPLLKNNLINTSNIIIDSKSGYSGAGKKFNISNIKNNNDLNFYNYNTNTHRHICEIKQELYKHSDNKLINFSFNPHILPIFRGMMSTIYCDLKKGINIKDIKNTYDEFSKKLPFIKFLNKKEKADFFSVQNNNNCLIKLYKHQNDSHIIIVSLIDNLLKGAAGQAVQCFNIMMNLDEKIGLEYL